MSLESALSNVWNDFGYLMRVGYVGIFKVVGWALLIFFAFGLIYFIFSVARGVFS